VGDAFKKVKVAGTPGAPRLQMAKRGFTTGVPKVIVFTPVKLPFRSMASPTVLGDVSTVPPIKEEVGFQIGDVPFMVVPPQHVPGITWPA
jgi:hypothetical protein